MKLPDGHDLEIAAQQARRERQKRCNAEVDALIADLKQPYALDVRDHLYKSLDFPNKVIRDAFGRHTNRLAYLHLVVAGVAYRLDGTATKVTDRMLSNTQIRIDGWDEFWRVRTEAEIKRRKNRDEGYQQFLDGLELKEAKKLKEREKVKAKKARLAEKRSKRSKPDKPGLHHQHRPLVANQHPVSL